MVHGRGDGGHVAGVRLAGGEQLPADAVVFNDLAATGTVVIREADVAPASVTIDNATLAYSFSGSKGIVGATGIVKNGAAAATFANTGNTFTGGVVVNAALFELLMSSPKNAV